MHNGIPDNCEDVQNELNAHIIYSITNNDGLITDVSEAFCQETGYSRSELIGKKHSILRAPDVSNSLYDDLWETITRDKVWRGEIKNVRKNGDIYWVNTIIQPMYDIHQHKEGYIAIRHDITREKMIEERAHFDELTGVYNRRKTNEELERHIKNFERYNDTFTLVMIDIDYFKQFNDSFGHLIGDEVLKSICTHINVSIREGDIFSRWGGEEFLLLLPHTSSQEALVVCEKLRTVITTNCSSFLYHNFGITSFVSCSFGVTTVRQDDTVDSLLGRVDRALYTAKENGRDRIEMI